MHDDNFGTFGSAIPGIEIETEIEGDLRRHETREEFPRCILIVDEHNQPRMIKLLVSSEDQKPLRAAPALLRNCSEHGLSIVTTAKFQEGESLLIRAQDLAKSDTLFEQTYKVQRRRRNQSTEAVTGRPNPPEPAQKIYTFGTLVEMSDAVEDSSGKPSYTYGLSAGRVDHDPLYKALYDSLLFEHLRSIEGFKASMYFELLESIAT